MPRPFVGITLTDYQDGCRMTIRWDALLARHVASELDAALRGAKLRALRLDGTARDLVVLFRKRTLLWRLHPRRGDLRLLDPLEPSGDDLRLKARLERVVAVPDDRVLRFTLAPNDPGRPPLTLVVELLGNQWNAFVTEGAAEEGAPEVVRHVLRRGRSPRSPRVGHPYTPPRPTGRAGVEGGLSLDAWLLALAGAPTEERESRLLRSFAWTSPLNAAALLGAPEEVGAGSAENLESKLELGYLRWTRMTDPEGTPEPVVLDTDSGPQPYPFPLPGTGSRPFGSLLAAIEACAVPGPAGQVDAPGAVAGIGPTLMRRLEREALRARRREARLRAELRAVEDPDALRHVGDLILARYGEIVEGAAKVVLTDFDGYPLEVELDAAAAPYENAERYYARAARAERARRNLPKLIEAARAKRERLGALVRDAQTGELDEAEVRDVLGPDERATGGQIAGPALPYRVFTSSGGLEIRVGRGSRHNDELTFRHSAPSDVWLHARHSAGAHVILKWSGQGRPPARDLEEAATLAALHSKARTSGSVPVDWTLRKWVRKPRKAPPGRVAADRVETLFVEPDPTLLDTLDGAP